MYQAGSRMLAFAILRISEPHRGRAAAGAGFFESALRRIDADATMTGTGESASMPRSVPGCERKAN